MEKKKYIEIICKNCGGHNLKEMGEYFKCQNCHSIYKKTDFKKKLIYRHSKLFWIYTSVIILITLLVVAFVIAPRTTTMEKKIEHPKSWYNDVGLGKAYKNQKEKEKSDRMFAEIKDNARWGLEHLDLTKSWTTEYFNSIKVAQMNFEVGSTNPTYSDGMLYSDLIKKIGAPDELENYGQGRKEAIFHYHGKHNSMKNWSISVFITYDTKTGMITDKRVMS
ncbi:hypothetical protein KUA55_17705 [Enterococcus sp. ALS3]|uniref:DUF3862 domain-containing protein n=1 Tax=Enterococcus alishanensis TaxID=1303817 RepID=A0ABS6THU1_9ENTE|nr:hypothetical protein [Enterococcus alishanensis]MBV7392489.1 hypothetical protein [Enterococcus alishanensis]